MLEHSIGWLRRKDAEVSLSWLWQPVAANLTSAGLVAFGADALRGPAAVRLADIQGAVEARRECSKRVLDILALCIDLECDWPPGERERWISQLGEATRWLADNWQWFALTYAKAGDLPGMMAGYAGAVRREWLSDHPLEQRVRRIRELTERVQTIYFVHRLRSAGDRPVAIKELREMIG